MLRSLCLTICVSILFIADSEANYRRDNWPNWYITLGGQVSFVSDADVSGGAANGEIEFDVGSAFSGAVGYRPYYSNSLLDNMRFELEAQYRQADFDTFDTGAGSSQLNTDLSGYSLMFNTYYDIYTGMPITPYFGGGLGVTWWDFDSQALVGGSDVNAVFAYQLMTGFYYSPRSMPNTDWGFGYRYYGTVDPEFENATGQTFEHDYNSHNLEFLARFRF